MRQRLGQPDSRYSSAMGPGATSGTTFYTVTASASANTKGSWAQIYSATPFAFDALYVFLGAADDTASRSYLVDVGIGAAASEQVVLPNLPISVGSGGTTGQGRSQGYGAWFPVEIPEGTRVAMRCQCDTGSQAVYVGMMGRLTGEPRPAGWCEMNGVSTGTSKGTSIDPGGTVNTKGSYTQITAATSFDYVGLSFFFLNDENTAPATAQWVIDIAIGAGGSEQIIIPDVPAFTSASLQRYYDVIRQFPISIPSGSRLAVRAACTTNDATDRLFKTALLGIA